MKLFNPLYEVYRRDDKTIVAQGTKDECDTFCKNEWYYSVRLSEEKLYTKSEVMELLSDILIDRDYIVKHDSIDYIKFNEWIDKKL